MSRTDIGRAIDALMAIPSDLSYPEWFKVLCAAKAAGISIDDIDAWCSTGSNYKGRQDVERTFRNIKAEGGITAATLFGMDKQYSLKEAGKQYSSPPSPAPKNSRHTHPIPSPSEILADIVANCEPATAAHPYIQKKLGLHDGLLVYKGTKTICDYDCNGALVLPLSDLDGNEVGAQFIPLEGKKVYPLGTKLPPEACLVIGGELSDGDTAYIVEGIGQAWTAHQATGAPAVVCFGKGRMAGVTKAIHARHPNLRLIIVPDGKGEIQAAEIALAVDGLFVEVPSGWPANYDINDFHKESGSLKEVAALLESARAPDIPDTSVDTRNQGNTLNDSGNAARLVKLFGQDIRWLPETKEWITWNGQFWVADKNGAIIRFAKATAQSIYGEAQAETDADKARNIAKWANTSHSLPRLLAMVELAKAEINISILMSALDQKNMLMGTPSGVVDLTTGLLREANRFDYITRTTSAQYQLDATCPNWEKFLERCFGGNRRVIEFIQRGLGYCLTGLTNEQVMFLLIGDGCNGKSVFLETIRAVLGDYAMQTQAETLMQRTGERASNDIARLRGARLVTAVEVEKGRRLAESLVKQLTGGDQIAARFLYGEFFEFKPTFKFWLAANDKPVILGDDHGIWRRICVIPFSVRIPSEEQDRQLSTKLAAEAPGVLQWMIRGFLEWQRSGLKPPPEMLEATTQYKSEMDIFERWLDAHCRKGEGQFGRSGELFSSFLKFAEQNGGPRLSQPKFSEKLIERGFSWDRDAASVKYWGLSLLSQE